MDGNKEVGFARNGRERDNLVPAVGCATCLGDAEEIEVGKLFRACLAWDCSRKEGRVQEIWTWENSKVLNQL
jgi:hypothetical protein